jgi:hypothetical protein
MNNLSKIGRIFILCLLCVENDAQQQNGGKLIYSAYENRILYQIQVLPNNDTIYTGNLSPIYIYPRLKFKNKAQEKFYWKTVRDVKKALPYARVVSYTLNKANDDLTKIPLEKDRKKYLKNLEHEVKKKYEPDIRDLTFNQGKLLIKMIDRETSMTSYELIKLYRGPLIAAFWQGVARLFGANLKEEYDGNDKDRIIERVITLVENGQL